MDKPLTFRTLSDLIFDFEDSYKKYLHTVKKVKIGLYVPHEPHSFQPIEWKQLVLNVSKMLRADIRKELEKFARDMRMKVGAGWTIGWCEKTLFSHFPFSLCPLSGAHICRMDKSHSVKMKNRHHLLLDIDKVCFCTYHLQNHSSNCLGSDGESNVLTCSSPYENRPVMLAILYRCSSWSYAVFTQ